MRTTPVEWIDATKELPSVDEFGPYPTTLVALACKDHPELGFRVRTAHLRFFGKDKSRPYWAGDKSEGNCAPLENDAWYVALWAPGIAQPTL
jgi:hypothetical protein